MSKLLNISDNIKIKNANLDIVRETEFITNTTQLFNLINNYSGQGSCWIKEITEGDVTISDLHVVFQNFVTRYDFQLTFLYGIHYSKIYLLVWKNDGTIYRLTQIL